MFGTRTTAPHRTRGRKVRHAVLGLDTCNSDPPSHVAEIKVWIAYQNVGRRRDAKDHLVSPLPRGHRILCECAPNLSIVKSNLNEEVILNTYCKVTLPKCIPRRILHCTPDSRVIALNVGYACNELAIYVAYLPCKGHTLAEYLGTVKLLSQIARIRSCASTPKLLAADINTSPPGSTKTNERTHAPWTNSISRSLTTYTKAPGDLRAMDRRTAPALT